MSDITYIYEDGQIVRCYCGRPEEIVCEATPEEAEEILTRLNDGE